MSQPLKNVVIAGASGNIGSHILAAFVDDSRFVVSVLARKSSKASYPAHVKVVRVDDSYPEAELVEAMRGQDAVVSAISSERLGEQDVFINAAAKAGVRRFVTSEFGSDTTNEKARAALPMFADPKIKAVAHAKEVAKSSDTFTWTAIVTGPFFEMGMNTGFLGFDLKNRKATITDSGDDVWCTSRFSTIGLAVKNALLVPAETANRYLYIDSFATSSNRVLSLLEKHSGGEKWQVEHVNGEEQFKVGLGELKAGEHMAGITKMLRYLIQVEANGGSYMAAHGGGDNKLLSLPENDDLEAAVVEVLKAAQA